VRGFAAAAFVSAAAWVPAGLAAWTLTTALTGPGPGLAFVTGAYALAWLTGFVIVIAPSGLGVREAALVALLAPEMGLGPATLLAVTLRFANVAGDLVAIAVTEMLAALTPPPRPQAATGSCETAAPR
jgi:uncharacterized membrane protein YbhN (UPF0104 family)